MAAKVDTPDRDFFEREVRHRLDHPLIEFLGEIDDATKDQLLGGARALLFPIDWPEPFGLTIIESLACGTPVISRPRGSAPELIERGVTGFIGETVEDMADAVKRLDTIDRATGWGRAE